MKRAKDGSGETRHPLVVVLYQCPEGHLYTPPDREMMIRQDIKCLLCPADPRYFELSPFESMPRTQDEYDLRVLRREDIELYGRTES